MSRLLPSLLLVLACLTTATAAQSGVGQPELARVRAVVEALERGDEVALADLVDFRLRNAEQRHAGQTERAWDELDELDQLVARRAAARSWIGNGAAFNRHLTLLDVSELSDPDAGQGPVPDRRFLRALVSNPVSSEQRELLLMLTSSLALLDLQLGEPHYPGAAPDGVGGLRPEARFVEPGQSAITWPADVDDYERAGLFELVDELLALPDGRDRDLVIERLHRNPHAAVSALLERLTLLETAPEPDASAEAIIDIALSTITGRSSTFRSAPRSNPDVPRWREQNHAAVIAWLRWHEQQGLSFEPMDIAPAIEPTVAEKHERSDALPLDRWEQKLREQTGAEPRSEPATEPPSEPASDPGDDVAPGPQPPARPPPADRPGVDLGVGSSGPSTRKILFPAAADLMLHNAGRRVMAREVEEQLSPGLIEALNAWAELVTAMDLQVVVSGNPDALVIGGADQALLEQVAGWVDKTWAILDPLVPLVGEREAKATVVLLFDEKGARSDAWLEMLSHLVQSRQLFPSDAERLIASPESLLRRTQPLFVQTSWDLTGEGEYRLENEIAHKFAQCFVTSRVGELPPTILWGLGELVEIQLFETVYQLNTTGFVWTADHFDWPRRTLQELERARKKRDVVLSELALRDSSAGMPRFEQFATWAALAWLAEHKPQSFAALFEDLADLHLEADPRLRSASYRGDRDLTRKVLETRFDSIDLDDLLEWLDESD